MWKESQINSWKSRINDSANSSIISERSIDVKAKGWRSTVNWKVQEDPKKSI